MEGWRVRLLLGAVCVRMLAGQSASGTLSGLVQDEKDGAVAGALVTLREPGKGSIRKAVTDDSGLFRFPSLAPSAYDLTAERDGFTAARLEAVPIHANDQRSVTLRLRVASRGERVEVTAEAAVIREGPAVSTSVDRSFIAVQPLNGRSFQSLLPLSPGVVMTTSTLPDSGQFSVNGQRTGTNYFTVDGVGANFGMPFASTPYEGAGGGTPSFSSQGSTSTLASVDAVQEFTVQTSTYAPEYGRQPGAQVAIVTRSGTNQFHGSAFNYLRNDKLDANSWFGNYNGLRRPALRQNDFGFTVGGPVLFPRLWNGKNRTFFFASYEGLRLIQPVISAPVRVPSAAARAQATGMVKALLEAYPLPVAPPLAEAPMETPYVTSFSNPSRLNATSVRGDHAVSQKLQLFGRYNYAPSENRERGRYVTPSFVATLPGKTETVTGGATMMFSPALTNDLRLNWSRSLAAQIYEQDTYGGAKLLPRDLLFPDFAKPETSLYYLTIGGNDENTISPGVFSRNTQRQWNIVNTTYWNKGSHAMKFGVDVRRLSPSIGGRLFSKTLTFASITELTKGIVPTGEVRQTDNYLEPRYLNLSLFAQDAWRVSRRLTLTYGLRWEMNPAPSEANGNLPLTVRGIQNPASATLGTKNSPLYETTYTNFAPRVGIAYQLPGDRGTVLRAGFGSFYDLGYAYTGTVFSPSTYPYSRAATVTNTAIDAPVFFAPVGALLVQPPYPRLFAYADDYQLPYSLQYSFAVEQPFGTANSLSISYVGSAGHRLARVESLRPAALQNPLFTRVDVVNNEGYSQYNSLQTQFKRRMARGAQALAAYTWSKSLDTASDESNTNLAVQSTRLSPSSDRGPSSFDARHVFTGAVSYDIPSWRAVRKILGGFSVDAIGRFRTATPVTVTTGRDPLGLGLTNVARPDILPGQPLYVYDGSFPGGRRFNRAAFDDATPLAQGRQGTLGRNVLRGFGMGQLDLSIRRRFVLGERVGLDLRADAFNLSNTPNFANPVGVMTNTNFGRSTGIVSGSSVGGLNPLYQMGGPRSVQLALKLQF